MRGLSVLPASVQLAVFSILDSSFYLDHSRSRARASYLSCVTVYLRESQSRVFLLYGASPGGVGGASAGFSGGVALFSSLSGPTRRGLVIGVFVMGVLVMGVSLSWAIVLFLQSWFGLGASDRQAQTVDQRTQWKI